MSSRPINILVAAIILGLGAPLAAQDKSAADQAPRMPELPPAQFDEALAIGGEEIEARKLRSRMTVEVEVNGKGPYKFVVDSGADTTAVGQMLAGKLALPDGAPTMLHRVT